MKKLGFICLLHMNRLTLISWFWLFKKTLVTTTNLTNPESASARYSITGLQGFYRRCSNKYENKYFQSQYILDSPTNSQLK